jgi:hypothetical protein
MHFIDQPAEVFTSNRLRLFGKAGTFAETQVLPLRAESAQTRMRSQLGK